MKIDRGMDWFYSPCIKVDELWRQHREWEEKKMEFVGIWSPSSTYNGVYMEIKENKEFTIKFKAQTFQGIGNFEVIDGSMYFIAQSPCVLEKYDEGKQHLVEVLSDTPTDQGQCRIQINVFVADSEEYVLASHVIFNDLNGEWLGFGSFLKIEP